MITMRKRLALLIVIAASLARAQASGPALTLDQARAIALKNHPQVLASQANYQRSDQLTREARSAYYPTINADISASQAEVNSRIGAGLLTDSRLFNRTGAGVTLSQLITDSGRTHNLVASAKLQAQASRADYQATQYDIGFGVDQAYYEALLATQLVHLANQTVQTRQAAVNQISELTRNKLRSQLDASLAEVNLADARLMLLRAQDRLQSAYASLAQALGTQHGAAYTLSDPPTPPDPPATADALIADAFRHRPELASLRLQSESARKQVYAERDLRRPNVTLNAVGGTLPYIDPGNANPNIPKTYEGVEVNVQVPIFNGFLFRAREQAAAYQLQADQQRTRDLQNRIARDVRTAYDRAHSAFEAIAVSRELLSQANMALDLAQGRYQLGLASIVELSQAQLGQTTAQVQTLNAKYEYQEAYAALQYATGSLH